MNTSCPRCHTTIQFIPYQNFIYCSACAKGFYLEGTGPSDRSAPPLPADNWALCNHCLNMNFYSSLNPVSFCSYCERPLISFKSIPPHPSQVAAPTPHPTAPPLPVAIACNQCECDIGAQELSVPYMRSDRHGKRQRVCKACFSRTLSPPGDMLPASAVSAAGAVSSGENITVCDRCKMRKKLLCPALKDKGWFCVNTHGCLDAVEILLGPCDVHSCRGFVFRDKTSPFPQKQKTRYWNSCSCRYHNRKRTKTVPVRSIPAGHLQPKEQQACNSGAAFARCYAPESLVVEKDFITYGFELEIYPLAMSKMLRCNASCDNRPLSSDSESGSGSESGSEDNSWDKKLCRCVRENFTIETLCSVNIDGFTFHVSLDTSKIELILEIITEPVYREYAQACVKALYEFKTSLFDYVKYLPGKKRKYISLFELLSNSTRGSRLNYGKNLNKLESLHLDISEFRHALRENDSISHCQINLSAVFGNRVTEFNERNLGKLIQSSGTVYSDTDYIIFQDKKRHFHRPILQNICNRTLHYYKALLHTDDAKKLNEAQKHKLGWIIFSLMIKRQQELLAENNDYRASLKFYRGGNPFNDDECNYTNYGEKDLTPVLARFDFSEHAWLDGERDIIDQLISEGLRKINDPGMKNMYEDLKKDDEEEEEDALDDSSEYDLNNFMIFELRNISTGHEVWSPFEIERESRHVAVAKQPEGILKILSILL